MHSEEEAKADSISIAFDYDYTVRRNANNSREFSLTFIVRDDPAAQTAHPQAYKLDLRINGFFRFDEGVEEDKMQWLIRYNGGAILFGILRGMMTSLTAAFPEGPIRMPTMMMDEVVRKVEGIPDQPPLKKIAKKAAAKKPRKSAAGK